MKVEVKCDRNNKIAQKFPGLIENENEYKFKNSSESTNNSGGGVSCSSEGSSDDGSRSGLHATSNNSSSRSDIFVVNDEENVNHLDGKSDPSPISPAFATPPLNSQISQSIKRRVQTSCVELERRKMFVQIKQSDLDKLGPEFLNQNKSVIRKAVSKMCHAERFWLTIKFCNLIDPKRSGEIIRTKICKLFGIQCISV